MINRSWLARDILNGQSPMNAAMAKFFQKLDSALKISIDDDTFRQAANFEFQDYNIPKLSTWNPILATLVWIEGEMPSDHLAFFADVNTLNIVLSEPRTLKIPFGMLIEMSENTKEYKLTWVNKPSGILVNPLEGNILFTSEERDGLKWHDSRSQFFEKDYWDLEIIKDLLPIAEKSMIGVASLFFGIMAILGGQELSNWQKFSILRN